MYQIIIRNYINGERDVDSVYSKTYSKKGNAQRIAKTLRRDLLNDEGNLIEQIPIVVGTFIPVTKDKAKEAYCHNKNIWVDTTCGKYQIPPTWEYGSHGPADVLFHRGIEQMCQKVINFYIEEE